jgi:pimeloyl-ACP methyl ester carboxylesterase
MGEAKVVEVRGIPIRYEEFGEGRPALWIHGVVTDRRHMVAELEPVFERRLGWRRLYPDLPGRGETPGADWIQNQDDILDVALEFFDAVAPGRRFIVGGTSFGGYLTLGILHRRAADIDGAALIVANPLRTGRTKPEHRTLVHDEALVAALDEEDREWAERAVVQSAEALQAHRETIAPAIKAADTAFLERVEEHTTFSFDVRQLAVFERPTLVLSARQDAMAGYVDMLSMLETFPRATWAILDRSGHGLPIDQRRLFEALTAEWLDRVEAEASARLSNE